MPILDGVKVLDATGFVSGPTCTAILASMGADVYKIEPLEGDGIRRQGPFSGPRSYPFEALNHNKKSIALNLKLSAGRTILHQLAQDSDIFIQSWRPGVASKLEADYDTLKTMNPALIYCSVSGFGSSGPYAQRGAVDIVAQAMGGLMGVTGEHGRPPVKVSYPITDVGSALWAVIGILSALRVRKESGEGQFIDVALIDSPVSWSFWEASEYFGAGIIPERLGSSHRNATPYRAFECADGKYLAIGVANDRLWRQFCAELHLNDIVNDSRFITQNDRLAHRTELESLLAPVFMKQDREVIYQALLSCGVPVGPVYGYDEVVADPHIQNRNLFGQIYPSDSDPLTIPNVPLYLSATPRGPLSPAPLLGADTEAALRDIGYSAEAIADLSSTGAIGVSDTGTPPHETTPNES